ncbi:hypothetical protein LTS17_002141 [Exophiala oligosperma]
MADPKTTTVQMDDGAKLHVKLFGDDSSKTKPLFIGLHGAPGLVTHRDAEAFASQLSSIFRVLVFDGRGSGVSDLIGPYTHDRWMKDIENLRNWAGAEKFVLGGHSYGGFLALDYAIHHIDRLQGLILIDTWTVGMRGAMTALANVLHSDRVKPDKDRQIRMWSGNLLSDQDYQHGITEVLSFYAPPDDVAKETPVSEGDQPISIAELFGPGGRFHIHAKTQNWAFSQNMPRFDVRQQLKDITVPTLVTVGRHDYVTPLHFAEEIASGIPDSRLEIFEHSGHAPHSDEPQKFNRIILEFLKTRVL